MRYHPQSAARFLAACLSAAVLGWPAAAFSQEWPTKPVTIISPGTPAGGMDLTVRPYLNDLGKRWKHGAVVENRPGAAGLVAALHFANVPPDGHTLMIHADSLLVYNHFSKQAPDGEKAFIPISILSSAPNVCFTNPENRVRSLAEFVARSKAAGGKFNVSSFTTSLSMLKVQYIVELLGIQATVVPSYNSTADQQRAVMSNDAQFTCIIPTAGIADLAKTEKLIMLATTSREKMPLFPEVPTLRSLGYNYDWEQWFGVFAPAGTPPALVARIKRDFGEVMKNPEVMAMVKRSGFDPETRSPDETVTAIMEELKLNKELIRKYGIKPQ